MFVRDVTDPEIAEQQAALRRGAVAAMVGLMEMEPPETRAGLERRNLEQLAEMVVGGFYALGDWWLRNRDGRRVRADLDDDSFMWLGLGRMQEGERWSLPAGGNHVADAEHRLEWESRQAAARAYARHGRPRDRPGHGLDRLRPRRAPRQHARLRSAAA